MRLEEELSLIFFTEVTATVVYSSNAAGLMAVVITH